MILQINFSLYICVCLYINMYIHINLYRVSSIMYFGRCVSVYKCYDRKSERMWNRWHNGPSTANGYTNGYRLISISLSVTLCDSFSDCHSFVCYCIQICMYEKVTFSVKKEYYCSLEKGNVGRIWALFNAIFFVPKCWLVLWYVITIQCCNGLSQFIP